MNKTLKILLLTDSFIILSCLMLGPVYAIYVEKIGEGILEASWAVALCILVIAFCLFSGKWKTK